MADAAPSLQANINFRKLWAAQTISLFGTAIKGEALPLAAILLLAATPAQMGLLGAFAAAPAFLIGLPAGVWVDRVRRRPLMIAADLGRAALLLTIPLAYLWGVLRIEHLYAVVLAAGVLGVFFDVSYQSIVPWLVGRKYLLDANSRLGMSDSLAEVAGPAVGGALVQLISAPLAILVDSISYLISAITLGSIRIREPLPHREINQPSMWSEVKIGLRAVINDRGLRALAGSMLTWNFFGSFIGALYGLYVIDQLGFSPFILGILVSSGGAGALLGAIVSARVSQRLGTGAALTAALLASSALTILIPLAYGAGRFSLVMLLAGQVLGDLALAVFFINEISLRQALTPDHLLGRVNASFQFLVGGAVTLGLLVGGIMGQAGGIRTALFISTAGMVLSVLWLLRSPIRHMRSPEDLAV